LGNNFPGYKLIDNAKRLGISNATHNNARGCICRILEQELIYAANGIQRNDNHIDEILKSKSSRVLNRVINLQTGSLVVEAGVKMMLARFYRVDDSFSDPIYQNRVPVFLVIGDYNGGLTANYHGTTVFTQMMREMWPGLSKRAGEQGMFLFVPVKINDFSDFREAIYKYDDGEYKVAGFIHELVLMNYGGIKLDEGFVKRAHHLCYERDIPTLVDEIQTCMWSSEFFLFREYNITPSLVTVGKGFPGGQYSASRLLLTAPMDNLTQFGALVTNGQEELSSLAYLITMQFAEKNRELIKNVGNYYKEELIKIRKKYENTIKEIEGYRHLSSIYFFDDQRAKKFVKILNDECIDVSIQSYKLNCPPSVITKLPIISTYKTVDFIIKRMVEAIGMI
jgi:acetylornithine/succinyldiaminopimelate/putrescine aminotransferase